jgi:hypothetical protein
MAEPKKQLTLLSRMGFNDSDLTTPLHDEIMLWLDAGLRSGALMPAILKELKIDLPSPEQWTKLSEDALATWLREANAHLTSLTKSVEADEGAATRHEESASKGASRISKKNAHSPKLANTAVRIVSTLIILVRGIGRRRKSTVTIHN